MREFLMLQKQVDGSTLLEGFSIPKAYQTVFYDGLGFRLDAGKKCPIRVRLNGTLYDAVIINQGFDREKYSGHSDVLQVRYLKNGPLSAALKAAFPSTWALYEKHLAERADTKSRLTIPEDKKEFLSVYASPEPGELLFDCLPNEEYRAEASVIRGMDERALEAIIERTDETAGFIGEQRFVKIRRMSRAVGNSLKLLYEYRCQICGERIGEPYGSDLVHSHHIDPFSSSLNNDADNILIVCPNHHGIIHDVHPRFDSAGKRFLYPNGYIEGLKLNFHL